MNSLPRGNKAHCAGMSGTLPLSMPSSKQRENHISLSLQRLGLRQATTGLNCSLVTINVSAGTQHPSAQHRPEQGAQGYGQAAYGDLQGGDPQPRDSCARAQPPAPHGRASRRDGTGGRDGRPSTTRSERHCRHIGRSRSPQRACAGRAALHPSQGPRSARSHPGSHRGTAAAVAAAFFSRPAEAAGSRQSRAAVRRSGGSTALPVGSAMPSPPCRRGAAVPSAILRRALFRALPARPAVPSASGRALPLPQRPAPRHGPQW